MDECQSMMAAAFRDGAKETEDNWEQRDRALNRLRQQLPVPEDGDPGAEDPLPLLLRWLDAVLQTLTSLRSTLLSTGCAVVADVAVFHGARLDPPVVERLAGALLKLLSQSKRLVVQLGSTTLLTLLRNTALVPRLLERFAEVMAGKNTGARERVSECLVAVLEDLSVKPEHVQLLQRNGGQSLDVLERCLQRALEDAGATAREHGRRAFELYQAQWPDRADKLQARLEPRIAKMLGGGSGKSTGTQIRKPAATNAIREVISSRRNNQQQRSSQPNSSRGEDVDDFEVVIYTKEVAPGRVSNRPRESSMSPVENIHTNIHEDEHSRELLRDLNNNDASFINVTTPGFGGKENMHLSFDGDNSGLYPNEHLDSASTPLAKQQSAASKYGSQSEGLLFKNQQPLSSEVDEQTTPKASNMTMQMHQTPKACGGMAGSRPSAEISFTPYFRQQTANNILQTPAPSESPVVCTPKSVERDKYLHYMQNRLSTVLASLSAGHMQDEDFKRLYKFSKDYAVVLRQENTNSDRFAALAFQNSIPKNRHMASAIVWHRQFPMVLQLILNQFGAMAESPEGIRQQEYCAIILNFMIQQHPGLFSASAPTLIKAMLRIRSFGEPVDISSTGSLSKHAAIFSAIQDALDNSLVLFDSILFAKILTECICSSPSDDPIIGVAFRSLAQLVTEKFNRKNTSQLHEVVLQPIFYSGTIERIIPGSPIISNRKSVFDFLTALWQVLGDDLITQYLAPDASIQFPRHQFKGLSPANFKLFQIILQQSQQVKLHV